MLLMAPGQDDRRIGLSGTTVDISADHEDGRPTTGPGFADIPSLDDMLNSHPPGGVTRNLDPSRVGCRITLTGGALSAEVPAFLVELPRHNNPTSHPQGIIPIVGTWTSTTAESGRLIVRRDGVVAESIDLTPATNIYIYNWDEVWNDPTEKQLTNPGEEPKTAFQDDDFKWLYQLLDPPSGMTWAQWLPSGTYFPAPRSIGFAGIQTIVAAPHGSPTGSCNAARMRQI
jgi:hypothetical protein